MATEKDWVESVKDELVRNIGTDRISVRTGQRLRYTMNVTGYGDVDGAPDLRAHNIMDELGYQTDLLICERDTESELWLPRVVVEFKLGSVTTHDALTYSAKAATHKSIHPYLRYGIVVGGYDGPVPKRLIRHGQQFDFMMTLPSEEISAPALSQLTDILQTEVTASQVLSKLSFEKSKISILHKKLTVM